MSAPWPDVEPVAWMIATPPFGPAKFTTDKKGAMTAATTRADMVVTPLYTHRANGGIRKAAEEVVRTRSEGSVRDWSDALDNLRDALERK